MDEMLSRKVKQVEGWLPVAMGMGAGLYRLVGGRFHWLKGSLHLKAKETDEWLLPIWGKCTSKSCANVTDEHIAKIARAMTGGH